MYALEAERGMDFRLERLAPVLDRLDHPERRFRAVHVAGTNGKGSTAATVHAILGAAGVRAGLYTSPHLLSFRERIRVGEGVVSAADVVLRVDEVRRAMDDCDARLTFFEIATLAAFAQFRAEGVDVAVVETGLGGRLDATNIIDAEVAVITSVGLEHTEYLGETVAEIAGEKAGIVKPGSTVLVGPVPAEADAVIDAVCRRQGASLLRHGRDFTEDQAMAGAHATLLGAHQRRNTALAAEAARRLAAGGLVTDGFVTDGHVRAGIAAVRWPGRLEVVEGDPLVVLDGAHNPHAADALARALDELAVPRPRVLVFGAMDDKDHAAMLRSLAPAVDRVVFVPVDQRRSESPSRLSAAAPKGTVAEIAPEAEEGFRRAVAGATGGSVVVAGSIFLVGQLYGVSGAMPDPLFEALLREERR